MSESNTTSVTQDVFELVLARPIVTSSGEHPRLVHLWWRSPQQGHRVVQVYIDQTLYDVTHDTMVRDMYLDLDRTQQHRIELLAIPADDSEGIWQSHSGDLNGWHTKLNSSAMIALVRDEYMPVDAQLKIVLDDNDVEYGPMWPCDEARAGSWTGAGVTYDGAFGLGLGIGELGAGPLGFDGTAWHWLRSDLDAGIHNVRITAIDHSGWPVSTPLEASFLIEQLPSTVTGLCIRAPNGIAWQSD